MPLFSQLNYITNVRSGMKAYGCLRSSCSSRTILISFRLTHPSTKIIRFGSTKTDEVSRMRHYIVPLKTDINFDFTELRARTGGRPACHSSVRWMFRQICLGMPLICKFWNVFICRITGYTQKNPHLVLTYNDFFKLLFLLGRKWIFLLFRTKWTKIGQNQKLTNKLFLDFFGFLWLKH